MKLISALASLCWLSTAAWLYTEHSGPGQVLTAAGIALVFGLMAVKIPMEK